MNDYVLIEYEVIDLETGRPKRKRILAGSSEEKPSTLNVFAMQRVGGFWGEGGNAVVEEEVFNELKKSLDKVMNLKMSIETIEFLKYDLTERLTYLFQTSTNPIFRHAQVI